MNSENVNISELVTTTINNLFSNLFNSIDTNIYPVLDKITFINEDIIENHYISKILGNTYSDGLILICNSLIIGFLIFYAVNYFISHITYHSVEKPQSFLFKIILLSIIANFSFDICKQIIMLNSLITSAILELGKSIFNTEISFSSLIDNLNNSIYNTDNNLNLFSLDGIIKSFTSYGLFNLIFTYSLRYIMIKVFILISPFAIITLSQNSTSWIFKCWIKSFISLLFVQIFIAIIMLLTFSINVENINSNDIFSKLIFIGSIYALIKANTFVKELFGGISTSISSNISSLRTILH